MCIWESLGIKIPVAPINSQKGSLAEKVWDLENDLENG